MENQFTLQGLALLTPDLKELISVKESPIFQEIKNRMFAKMRAEFAQREKIMIQWEANGFLLPGAREAMAAKFEEMLSRYINEPDENHLLLQDAQKSDRKTAQDAYDAWLFTARPTPAQALLGAAKMRAELRAAGIIEDGPGASPVGGSVVSSSPTRPAPAVAPTVAPKPLAGAAALPPELGPVIPDPSNPPWTLADIDRVAEKVTLTDSAGRYASPRGKKGLGSVVGFVIGLKESEAVFPLSRTALLAFFGNRYGVTVATEDPKTGIAKRFATDTERIARTMFPDKYRKGYSHE